MIQEIITYIILVFAVGMAFYKSFNKLKRKKLLKSTKKKTDPEASKSACSVCVAECILRDAPTKFKTENPQHCEKTIENIRCS